MNQVNKSICYFYFKKYILAKSFVVLLFLHPLYNPMIDRRYNGLAILLRVFQFKSRAANSNPSAEITGYVLNLLDFEPHLFAQRLCILCKGRKLDVFSMILHP